MKGRAAGKEFQSMIARGKKLFNVVVSKPEEQGRKVFGNYIDLILT